MSQRKPWILGSLKSIPSMNSTATDQIYAIQGLAERLFALFPDIYPFHNNWKSHAKSVMKNIDNFVVSSDLQLGTREWVILVSAVLLHDVGKVLPEFHPVFKDADPKPPRFAAELLEEAHHLTGFAFLKQLLADLAASKTYWRRETASAIQKAHLAGIGGMPMLLKCSAWLTLSHKELKNEQLLAFRGELFGEIEGNLSSQQYQYWSEPEKLHNRFMEHREEEIQKLDKEILEEFSDPSSIPQKRFDILSALLNLGDKLDISERRLLYPKFYLAVLLDDLGFPSKHPSFPGPRVLARWFQFRYAEEPRITFKGPPGPKQVTITIPYRYPECLKENFHLFRYHAERDFEDLSILSTLETAIQEQFSDERARVSIYREEQTKKGKGKSERPIIGLRQRNDRMLYCLQQLCECANKKEDLRILKQCCATLGIQGESTGTKESGRSLFPCKVGSRKIKCLLLELVRESLDEDAQPSNADWASHIAKRPNRLLDVLCKRQGARAKKRPYNRDEKRFKEYLGDLQDPHVMLALSPRAEEGIQLWKKMIEAERKPGGALASVLFYTSTGPGRRIPASMDVAYMLNLFRHLRGESLSIDDIVIASGLDRGRVLMNCGRLEHEGFLLLDGQTETYRLNPERIRDVEKTMMPFDSQPAELVAKVRDIQRFGKPLALYSGDEDEKIATSIAGLDKILSPDSKLQGLPRGKVIVLLGPPGSGKTTFALEIIKNVRRRRLPKEPALFLTFEEDVQRLGADFKPFGWTADDMAACVRSLSTLRRKTYISDPDRFLAGFISVLDESSPELVAVDNLGYFLQLAPPEASREVLNRLIRVFTVRGITTLLLGEEDPNRAGFESYDVDGVMRLKYEKGERLLEIVKMRGRDFAGGEHPFAFVDSKLSGKAIERCVEVYPNVEMHIDRLNRNKEREQSAMLEGVAHPEQSKDEVLTSGIDGLDNLLPIYPAGLRKKQGFAEGEAILVLGSPGSGKTLLGLHFIKKGWEDRKSTHWVSFESDTSGLHMATRSFGSSTRFEELINQMRTGTKKSENVGDAHFRFYAPAQIEPQRLVNDLLDECKDKKLKRLVLDSVTDIEQVFRTEADLKIFMTSLVQLLKEHDVTTMFLYRTKGFFGKTEDIGRVLSSVVDTIICLKIVEIHNAIQKGLFLLKVRGREHKSGFLSVDFREDEGMIVQDRGWTMSGLISGEAGEIREPNVSVKLFYENRNESLINTLMVREYSRRFVGGKTSFVSVRKHQIYSEFWSFKGSSGAGHSNVRVVSLCDYWATLFNRQHKLYDLWPYVNSETRKLVREDEFWRRCASYSHKEHAFEIFAMPNYVDVGVLAFHEALCDFEKFWKEIEPGRRSGGSTKKITPDQAIEKLKFLTWNKLNEDTFAKLVEIAQHRYARAKDKETFPRYLFAMPALVDTPAFVSFFLEVFWSFGGVIFDFRELFDDYAEYCLNLFNTRRSPRGDLLFYESPSKKRTRMWFVGEMLLLVPERILNEAIKKTNARYHTFIGDICRAGDVLLFDESRKNQMVARIERDPSSVVASPEEALTILETGETRDGIIYFVRRVRATLKVDPIWRKNRQLKNALNEVVSIIESLVNRSASENEKRHLLIILFNVYSRVVTNRERYEQLLSWLLKTYKNSLEQVNKSREQEKRSKEQEKKLKDQEKELKKQEEQLERLISLDRKNEYAKAALSFLAGLVDKGIAPNPHEGDLSAKAYLARMWSGDVSEKPPSSVLNQDYLSDDLKALSDEREKVIKKERHHIVALPSYERETTGRSGNGKQKNTYPVPSGKWSYTVFGLWSLGIMSPAVSPEIGWIFIDALTEDIFRELRAKMGLGLPAKTSIYHREKLRESLPEIYGSQQDATRKGIVQNYKIATQDKPRHMPETAGGVHFGVRERAMIPHYYKIEGILGKELGRFFNPSFFEMLKDLGKKKPGAKEEFMEDAIDKTLGRINRRIFNFICNPEE
jgi:circadian clock protein KaiC